MAVIAATSSRPRLGQRGKAARRSKALAGHPMKSYRRPGLSALRAITAGLDERGIPAARGGKWSAVQVARLLGAAGIPFVGRVPGGASVGTL